MHAVCHEISLVVSRSSCSYCEAVDVEGTRYLVPRLGLRRLVPGTAAAATCPRS